MISERNSLLRKTGANSGSRIFQKEMKEEVEIMLKNFL